MKNVNASIITIGDELLIGQTIDSNSAFIGKELNKIGIWVRHRVAVGDDWNEIWHVLDEESEKSDVIIITGGLGPTADDITKPLLCKYFSGKLVMNEQVLQHIKYLFEKVFHRTGPLAERNIKQAEVPDTCTVLHNPRGTAPGMKFEKNNKIFFSLPGVPYEMKGLMIEEVIPVLKEHLTLPAIIHKTFFTVGQGESVIADKIKNWEESLPENIKLAYLPAFGMVKLRLTAKGDDTIDLENQLAPYINTLREFVKDYLVAEEDLPLEVVIGKILKEKNKTMATAESCTGGYIAHLITSVPGSSQYYKGSVVSYANEVKENILGVNHETLRSVGAVSKETVLEMVKGVIEKLNVDYAVATSGIMGPDGGSTEKPVGTVWIAVGHKTKTIAKQFHFRFERERNIEQTATTALNVLRKFILTSESFA
ncbi:MAG: competence/damage-inducible protein A [Bacteroidetes bacterium]|nr:competence/damage-inducible protein A [Bacteroidota bacterium]MBS1930184.1 competence/damage-inducible protein A [Bacteroidota bacterium]